MAVAMSLECCFCLKCGKLRFELDRRYLAGCGNEFRHDRRIVAGTSANMHDMLACSLRSLRKQEGMK